MNTLSQDRLEQLRIEGIDAYDAGKARGTNPYSYEAANAWDAGWMQGAQADAELAQLRPVR